MEMSIPNFIICFVPVSFPLFFITSGSPGSRDPELLFSLQYQASLPHLEKSAALFPYLLMYLFLSTNAATITTTDNPNITKVPVVLTESPVFAALEV